MMWSSRRGALFASTVLCGAAVLGADQANAQMPALPPNTFTNYAPVPNSNAYTVILLDAMLTFGAISGLRLLMSYRREDL